jgi:5-formyltetrahydrofolate cyclo-ligase
VGVGHGDGPGTAGGSGAEALAGEKAALRRSILAVRARLTEAERVDAGRALRDAVLALPQARMAGTVAVYHSIGAEPATHGLVYAFWKRGSYVLLPLLRPDLDLDWACYEGPDSLRPGPRGLMEPTAPPRGAAAVASADLVIVPALAVDRRGGRLGRGGGSYDRALARVGTQVPSVALIYDDELLDEVPAAAHDQRVRLVARPSHEITGLPLAMGYD